MKVLVLLCVLVMGSSVSAQDYITGTYSTNGRHTYGYFSDGSSATTTQNGRFSYSYFSDGSRSTTTQIGNRSYTDIWLAPKPIQYAPIPIWASPKPIRYDVDPRILWGNRAAGWSAAFKMSIFTEEFEDEKIDESQGKWVE